MSGVSRVLDRRILTSRDVKANQSVIKNVSVASLLGTNTSISSFFVHPTGVPVVITSQPAAYAYSTAHGEWTIVATDWWTSDAGVEVPGNGPLSVIEREVARLLQERGVANGFDSSAEWTSAMLLGRCETRLRAAELFRSRDEYGFCLERYAGLLGEGGFRAKAEELIRELCGKVESDRGGWDKSEFLPVVLGGLSRSPRLAQLAESWARLLDVEV